MPATDEPEEGRRLALIIATASYADPTLAGLRAPGRDADKLADVLASDVIGGFAVDTVLDAPADTIRRRVARFCAGGEPRDLALIYLSCHGVLDDRGRLYYATADTDRELLSVTAVPAAWLNEHLEDCRCRRQIVILDCCHSGAFAKGAKGEGALALRERFEGRGRVVLTASRGTEYSFEGDRVVGDGASSVFTGALVDGLRTGDADGDGNGLITANELYDYAYQAVKASGAQQTPSLWSFGAEGSLVLARSPRGALVEPAPLPMDLSIALESPRPRVREGAVAELADLLAGPDAGRALSAREHLVHMAAEDLPLVATAARAVLDAHPEPEPAAEAARAAPTPSEARVPEPTADRAVPDPRHGGSPPGSSGDARAAGADAPGKPRRVARAFARHRARSALLVGLALVALIAVVVVLSGGSGTDGTTESYENGASITMQPLAGTQESARARLVVFPDRRDLELTDLKLARGQDYKLLLFDELSSVRKFDTLPDFAEIVRHYAGARGELVPDSSDSAQLGLPENYRDYRYFGIAAVAGSAGQLKLYRRTGELPEPR